MNSNFKRRKLGIGLISTSQIDKLKTDLEMISPITFNRVSKESLSYSTIKLKNINLGTLKKPNELLTIIKKDNNQEIYNEVLVNKKPEGTYYYSESESSITTAGELLNYGFVGEVDPENPYDPLFSSFNRFISRPVTLFLQSGVTGLRMGQKEQFFNLTNGFQNVQLINFLSTSSPKLFTPTNNLVNGKNRYMDKSSPILSDLVWSPEFDSWIMREKNKPSIDYNSTNGFKNIFVNDNKIPTGKWSNFDNVDPISFLVTGAGRSELNGIYVNIGLYSGTSEYVCSEPKVAYSGLNTNNILRYESGGCVGAQGGLGGWFLSPVQPEYEGFTAGEPDDYHFLSKNIPASQIHLFGLSPSEEGGTLSPAPKLYPRFVNNQPFFIESEGIDFQGFFKIASTRSSNNKERIFAKITGDSISIGQTEDSLPSGFTWVTYPHSYNPKSFPAFRYDLIVVPEAIGENNATVGLNDLIIISTGVKNKKIIYVSPHKLESFNGCWGTNVLSNRAPKTGVGGKIINTRNIFNLRTGSLISVTSEDINFSGLNPTVFGEASIQSYNLEQARLKQETPLNETDFYKLYEPVFRKNALSTTTWDGIIPSGTPFQVEIIRTKSTVIGSPNLKLNFYAKNFFISGVNNTDPNYCYYITNESASYGLFGNFYSKKLAYSPESNKKAQYIAKNKAEKDTRSKLFGTLWDKGFTKNNSKVRKTMKLFNSGSWPSSLKCFEVLTPEGSIVQCVKSGVYTSAGIRTPDDNIYPVKCNPYLPSSNPLSCSFQGPIRLPIKPAIL